MYCEIFDWLIENGYVVEMERNIIEWCAYLYSIDIEGAVILFHGPTFHEAANAAIEKACALLKEV